MSKNTVKNIHDEVEEDEIDPSELIDTQENKPKITQHIELNNNENQEKINLTYKQVSKLTDEEKDYLINLYKNGEENDLYKVYFYKNGTHKIVKKKQPPKYNTTKRLLEAQKPAMTNEQILMEHVIDLETKFATLYQKHKKLKKNYKSLHEDLYVDEDDDRVITPKPQTDKVKPIEEPHEEPHEQQTIEQPQEQYTHNQVENEFQNNYIGRLRKPQKGYRKMMASLY